jgi:hypothetical protein
MNLYRIEYFQAGGRRIRTILVECTENELDYHIQRNMPSHAVKETWDCIVKGV